MTHDPKELATLLAGTFVERKDAKAIQTKTGAYMPVREDMKDTGSPLVPWRLSDVIDHVEGRKTYGNYIVSTQGTCRVVVFDCDLRAKANPARDEEPIMFAGEEIDPREVWAGPNSAAKRDLALQLRVAAQGFAIAGKRAIGKALVAYSGSKGMHAYIPLDPGTTAVDAREIASCVLDTFEGDWVPDKGKNFFKHAFSLPAVSVEIYPKQDDVAPDGFGNLVRLPLGVNQKSGKSGFFIDMSTPQDVFKIDDPIIALREGSLR